MPFYGHFFSDEILCLLLEPIKKPRRHKRAFIQYLPNFFVQAHVKRFSHFYAKIGVLQLKMLDCTKILEDLKVLYEISLGPERLFN